jgi:hypothetical protein
MSAVCPTCGVSVVPGYVRCPRCHAGLPSRARRTTGDPGGTAVVKRGFPLVPVLIALGVAAVVILAFGLRSASKPTVAAPVALPGPVDAIAAPVPPRVTRTPRAAAVAEPATPASSEPDRRAAATALEGVLRRQRLWGRAEILGDRIDVRSGSCGDAAMRPAIDATLAVLRGAGLTRLRCVEQSGAVVFERDL